MSNDVDDRRLLVGTQNVHKVGEIAALLDGTAIRAVTPAEAGADIDPEETGDTFEANALLKARAFSQAAGLVCLADDSGLVVDALDGRPGIYSARYAPTDAERIARLLGELEGVDDEDRTARFVCAAALVDPHDGRETVLRGICEGRIAHAPRGAGGFGYDPIFLLGDEGRTMAELTSEEKNAVSHRGAALRAIRPHIVDWLSG